MTTMRRVVTRPSPRARGFAAAVARLLARLALVALLAAVLAALTVLLVLPRLTGAVPLTVVSGSMTPGIPVGSMVLVRPVDAESLEVGDVATYQSEPGVERYVTHRVVGIDASTTPPSYVFQGDANPGPDVEPVPPGAIRGEVWFHVPWLGAIKNTMSGSAGLGLLAMILLSAYAAGQVGSALRDHRRERGSSGTTVPRQRSAHADAAADDAAEPRADVSLQQLLREPDRAHP